jgi:hypothetical protein
MADKHIGHGPQVEYKSHPFKKNYLDFYMLFSLLPFPPAPSDRYLRLPD